MESTVRTDHDRPVPDIHQLTRQGQRRGRRSGRALRAARSSVVGVQRGFDA